MPTAKVYPMRAIVGAGWTAMARIQNPDGNNALISTISTITYDVMQQDGTKTVDGVSLTVANVIVDTLVDDGRWTEDNTGRNFLWEVPAAAFPSSGHYRVVFTFTPTVGSAYKLIFEGPAISG